MIIFTLISALTVLGVNANGELSILQHPKSVTFNGHEALDQNTLKEVYTTALGFSNSEFSDWNGIFIKDPFNLAEGLATVSVEGLDTIDQPKGHNFPLSSDVEDDTIFSILNNRIDERYPNQEPNIVLINLQNGLDDISRYDLLKGIKSDKLENEQHLKLKTSEDREFLREMHLLNLIADKISDGVKSDGTPDLFWFKIGSLQPLVGLYGDNSTQLKEAKKLLNDALLHLNQAFKKAYKGDVLFSVITKNSSRTRKTRSILASDATRNLNLASNYSEDFPVIFNIILWLCVVLGFSLLAICLVIGNMDPGRDSIIYRMTNPRMKKDN